MFVYSCNCTNYLEENSLPCTFFFSISLVSHGSQVRYFEMGFEFTYYIIEWRDMQTAYSGLPLQTKTRVDFKST